MNDRTKYSDQEKHIIDDAIRQHPNNRRMAFDHAATLIPSRTAASISAFWYAREKKKKTKRKYNKRGSSHEMTIHSPQGEMIHQGSRNLPMRYIPPTKPVKQRALPARQSGGLSAFDVALVAIQELTTDEMKALIAHMMRSNGR